MRKRSLRTTAGVGLFALLALVLASGSALAQEEMKKPEPGVPQIFTLTGEFVRIAYNNEGYVSLGYRTANQSVGEEWMLLEVGATLREGVKEQKLLREAFSIDTPAGGSVPLASQVDYMKANLTALDMRADTVRDSINYFPSGAVQACRIGFFAVVSQTRQMPFDEVNVSYRRACLGRLYFQVPGGIKHGQHYLNVKFEKSLIRVPFRILTKEEEKEFRKTWPDIKKEHEKTFKQ